MGEVKKGLTIDERVEKLVIDAKKNSVEAFEELIQIYKEYIYKTSFLYVKNEHDASDIYGETIYKAFVNINKIKDNKSFKTWITTILINNVKDKYRKESKFILVKNSNELDIENQDVIKDIDLYNEIDKLSHKYKTAIILRYIHDMRIKDVAKIMKVNENTAKTNIRRGINILKNNLREG